MGQGLHVLGVPRSLSVLVRGVGVSVRFSPRPNVGQRFGVAAWFQYYTYSYNLSQLSSSSSSSSSGRSIMTIDAPDTGWLGNILERGKQLPQISIYWHGSIPTIIITATYIAIAYTTFIRTIAANGPQPLHPLDNSLLPRNIPRGANQRCFRRWMVCELNTYLSYSLDRHRYIQTGLYLSTCRRNQYADIRDSWYK